MKKNKIISIIALVLMSIFMVAAIAGVVMGCAHSLILLVPAVLLAIYPTINFIKSFKNKLSLNK